MKHPVPPEKGFSGGILYAGWDQQKSLEKY